MNPWLDWGTPLILWLQSLGQGLYGPMAFFTFLGTEEFYLLVLPALYWCLDAGLGLRVGLLLLTSAGLNSALKQAFGWPRPFWVEPQVQALSVENSFGLPSGHAQNAVALWGRLGASLRRRWATLGAGLLILLISLSRLYLGVHYPADVLAGWLVGGLLLAAFLRLEAPLARWTRSAPLPGMLGLSLALSLLLLALAGAADAATSGRAIAGPWQQAYGAQASEPLEVPAAVESALPSAGALFGLAAGATLLFRGRGFDAGGPWSRRGLRFALGVAGVVVVFYGLRALFPSGDSLIPQTLRFLRYTAVGLWIAYGAPRLFQALRLA